MRGIRGAICAHDNTREEIRRATRRLLEEICERNRLRADEIVAAFFTMTGDLNAEFPAYAAREMGWTDVPMLGALESLVPGAPDRAIRVLVLATGEGQPESVYLGRAAAMRPDLARPGDEREWDGPIGPSGKVGELGRLLVVGLGLIGGSVAVAARSSGRFERVVGYDSDLERTGQAHRLGLIDRGGNELPREAAGADIVVLAAPAGEIVRLVDEVAPALRPGALLTDVGSAKRNVVAAMNRLPEAVRAVAGHPMTGKTESGPAAASATLFRHAPWTLIATHRSDGTARELAERFVLALGGRPVWMDAGDHDRAVARSSHLPVLVAAALVRSVSAGRRGTAPPGPVLVGPGFRLATRLSASDPIMTAQMLGENADEVQQALDGCVEELARLSSSLRRGGALAERLADARAERAALLAETEAGE